MKNFSHPPSLLFLLLLLQFDATTADDKRHLAAEKAALTALMLAFNNPVLNAQWVGTQCYLNQSYWLGIRCANNRVTAITLEGIGLSGRIHDPLALANLTELTLLSFKNNSISGNMMDFSANPKISTIDLSMNRLTGPILPLNQTSLKAFNVSYNSLTGEIPETATLQSFDPSSYVGNPGLCGEPTPVSCQPKKKTLNMLTKSPFKYLLVILGIFVLILLIWILYVFCKKERMIEAVEENKDIENGEVKKREVVDEEERKVTLVNGGGGFRLDDLLKSTAEGLGKGSFGSCYKAKLGGERAIVVKRLRDVCPLTTQEFVKQMSVLGSMKHANLSPLLGYYCAMEEKFLFYDYASSGNLYDRIHARRGEDRVPFLWDSRLSVAKGVAKAMEFLHRNSKNSSKVPHGNLKSSNVLLDRDGVALVCDYGLVPLVSTPLAALRMVAFRSPEYKDSRVVSRKSDVWSFGYLLLELVTGRKSDGTAGEGDTDLYSWVNRAVREEWTYEIFDAEISGKRGMMRGMVRLLQIGLRCCERLPERRPDMVEVAREMEGIELGEGEGDEEYSFERSFVGESISTNGSSGVFGG